MSAESAQVRLKVNGVERSAARGTTVAAFLFGSGVAGLSRDEAATPPRGEAADLRSGRPAHVRRSVTGEPRAPLCGMGTCFECRVTVDGRPQVRSCLVPVREGMEVRTDG